MFRLIALLFVCTLAAGCTRVVTEHHYHGDAKPPVDGEESPAPSPE